MYQAQIISSQITVERISLTGQVTRQSNISKRFNIITTHLSTERMTSTDTDSPFIKITIITHGDKSRLYMLAGFFRQLETRSIRESDEFSYCCQYSGGIAGIKTSVMESSPIHFYTANCSGGIA